MTPYVVEEKIKLISAWLEDIPYDLSNGKKDRAQRDLEIASQLLSQLPPGSSPEWLESKFLDYSEFLQGWGKIIQST